MLFHYTRTGKRQALSLAINILLLHVLLYVFSIIAKDQSNFEKIYVIAEQIMFAIGIVLAGVMLWFLMSKQKFELYVTEDEFYSMHPIFKEWCFTVNPKDIKSIKHRYSVSSEMTSIDMIMNNGDKFQICKNYGYSRKHLYEALKKANPLIELPENANIFKSELSPEMDELITRRFPVMTKFFKWLFRK